MSKHCNRCNQRILAHSKRLTCYVCLGEYHIKCIPIETQDYIYMRSPDRIWFCSPCNSSIFPCNIYEDDEMFVNALYDLYSEIPLNLKEIDNMIFNPLSLNVKSNFPLYDIDPDIQFYNEIHHPSKNISQYFLEDAFNQELEQVSYSDHLSMFHINIRSMQNKFNELDCFMSLLKLNFTIIGITETWISDANYGLYEFENYSHNAVYRQDKRGGGVSLFVRDGILYSKRPDLNVLNDLIECVFVEVDKSVFQTPKNLVFGVIYRPPNTSPDEFLDKFSEMMHKLKRENKICYLLGDYNLDLLKNETHLPTSNFLDLMYSCSFLPLIHKPTRVTKSTATLIDNIFTNHLQVNLNTINGILLTNISDHFPIFHMVKSYHLDSKDIIMMKRKISDENLTCFIGKLAICNWNEIVSQQDPQSAYDLFHDTYSTLYNECFPMVRYKYGKRNSKPWLTEELKHMIKKKNLLYKKSKQYPSYKRESEYRSFRNIVSKRIHKAEKTYYRNLLEEHKGNVKKFWQITKFILNKNKRAPLQTKFKYRDNIISDGSVIVEQFNSYFVNIGPSTAAKIPSSNTSATSYLKGHYENSFYCNPVTAEELQRLFGNLKESACGWDNFDSKVIKHSSYQFLEPFMHICNLSLEKGVFPRQLKIAKVIPLYKSGDDMLFSNYRPVSILPIFSKILERIMYNRLILYVEKMLNSNQFGFRKDHSAAMALICLVDKISKAIENGEYVLGLFLDFSKAFDTVNYDILFMKLSHYGIRGCCLSWFKSYLLDRVQYVSYNNHDSSTKTVKCGVPQGSILGPLLFLIYVNDLSSVSNLLLDIMFADDTNLFLVEKNLSRIELTMNTELDKINKWIQVNKLSLNLDKTNFMIFKGRKNIASIPKIIMNDVEISCIEKSKFLGVIIDDKLTWIHHIDHICKKISKSIGIMYKLQRFLDTRSMINMYYCFVYPYLQYCNEVWGNAYSTHLNRIKLLQKRVIRVIANVDKYYHTDALFTRFKILKFQQINHYMIGQIMYKAFMKSLPEPVQSIFVMNETIYDYDTRQRNDFHLPKPKSNLLRKTVAFKGVIIWKYIRDNIDFNCSYACFKQRLKCTLLVMEKEMY